MNCVAPVQLKSGLVVPCGKCLLCYSARRDEWSVRLQLHTELYDRMPFFVTLTYEDKNLTYGDYLPTLVKRDLNLFIKRLKEKFNLHKTNFAHFGCGEYGEQGDAFGVHRPHYHLILFGFDELWKAYDRSWLEANKLIRDVWKLGNVDVGPAQWSGIHYVTKYVLKYLDDDYEGIQKPFIVYSKGIGKGWIYSRQGNYLRRSIDVARFKKVLSNMPELDTSDIVSLDKTARYALNYLRPYVPNFMVCLPSGRYTMLPRYIRRKLLGSVERFKDNPFWIVKSLEQLCDSTQYLLAHGEYDAESDVSFSQQLCNLAEYKIKKRLLLK